MKVLKIILVLLFLWKIYWKSKQENKRGITKHCQIEVEFSNLTDNLSDNLHQKNVISNCKNCKFLYEYEKVEDNLLLYSCIKCVKYRKT